jgi:hypothetical protein
VATRLLYIPYVVGREAHGMGAGPMAPAYGRANEYAVAPGITPDELAALAALTA